MATAFFDTLQPLESAPSRLTQAAAPRPQAAPAPVDTQRLLQEAALEADRIAAEARRQAEEVLEDARAQAEAMREAAWQEGRYAGQESGRAEALTTARAEVDAERNALLAELQSLTDGICAERQKLWERQESEMIEFVLAIARQVIKSEVTQSREVIVHILQNALRRVMDKEQVKIRVSVLDAPRVRALRDESAPLFEGFRNLEIVEDRRIGDGGCVIETNAGTIDAKIETQMAEVERAVRVPDDE